MVKMSMREAIAEADRLGFPHAVQEWGADDFVVAHGAGDGIGKTVYATIRQRKARGEKVGWSVPVRVGVVSVYVEGSGLFEAFADVVGEYQRTHTRASMVSACLEFWPECFKRSARSRARVVGSRLIADDRVALDSVPSFVLAVILNQL